MLYAGFTEFELFGRKIDGTLNLSNTIIKTTTKTVDTLRKVDDTLRLTKRLSETSVKLSVTLDNTAHMFFQQ
jgi:hypothetical protein